MTQALQKFFRDYSAAATGPESAGVAAFYAENFIAASPRGSAVFKNDDKFLQWLAQLHTFNQRSGMVSMEVVSIAETTSLSARHLLATVEWGARFTKTGDRLIKFRIAYFLEQQVESWKILAYVSEKDQEEEMRELGLL